MDSKIVKYDNKKDLIKAKKILVGHTIALVRDDKIYFSDKKGISPMMDFIEQGLNLSGFSVADVIVGKAAAMLFVKSKIVAVFAKVISSAGLKFLQENNIYVEYEILTDNIINRKGDDICPMEKTVLDINVIDLAYEKLKETLSILKNNI